jgi:hypothetical protein
MPHRKYNLDASKLLIDHAAEAFRLHRHTADLIAGTRKAIIQSRALMAELDDDRYEGHSTGLALASALIGVGTSPAPAV